MSRWLTDQILAEARDSVASQTAGWTVDQLREALARIKAACRPLLATLEPLAHGNKYEATWVDSDLFPYQYDAAADKLTGDPEWWGMTYNKDSRELEAVVYDPAEPKTIDLSAESKTLPDKPVHPSFNILRTHATYSIASVFIGSFGSDDVLALEQAINWTPVP